MSQSSPVGYTLLMLAAGFGIPIMAALNSALGARIGSPWLAVFILFCLGLLASGIVLAAIGLPKPFLLSAPPQYFAGGLLVAFYALSITWAAPRIGVGNAIFAVLLGQIAASALIDQFGLFGVASFPLSLRRIAGIACMTAGVFLARRV